MAATNGLCKPARHLPEREGDWEADLSEDRFAVCRLKATEIVSAPFTRSMSMLSDQELVPRRKYIF